ncbi:hypothetical protein IJG78_00790 [Candidatus Saccharibacteria bacterium]|nr:hypothetical protein [Candidatus Saccharibacteria bacterium]
MQLLIILLVAVSILTLLSGIAVLSGARKGERFQAFLFFFITLFALGWSVSIGTFLSLPENTTTEISTITALCIYLPALFMSWGLAVYPIYKYKAGKVVMIVYAIYCLALFILPLLDHSILYSSITLSEANGNIVHLQHNLYNYMYMGYFISTCLIYMIGLWYNARHAKSAQIKKANLMVLIGFTITGVIALIFDVILSFAGKYDTIWAGPLAMSFAWVFHYYAILKYRLLDLSGNWLKTLSVVIIMSLAAIIYLTIFFIIFIALFKIPSPSISVIVLNVIMIAIVLLLFPVLNEVNAYVKSLASVTEIDMSYIVKKLETLSKEYINYYELSEFLAEHLHFRYIGLIIGGKLYGSKQAKLSANEISYLDKLKNSNDKMWIKLDGDLEGILKKDGVEMVAVLKDPNGEIVGKILIGRPLGNINFSSRNISSIETAIVLTASAITSERKARA